MPSSHHDLIFLHGGKTENCLARVDKHFKDYFTFQFITSGHLELEYDDRSILLAAPAAFTCFPGPRIRFKLSPNSPTRWDHHYLAFRGSRVSEWLSSGLFFFGEQRLEQPEPLASAMIETIEIFEKGEAWARERTIARLESLLADLAHLRQAQRREAWLESCLSLIQANHQPDYDLISRKCHLSLSHLRRKFKEAMGLTLHDFWLDLRLREAGRLMEDTRMSLAQVAERLGYSDVSFFSRQFRSRMGVSPKDYRRSLFAGEP